MTTTVKRIGWMSLLAMVLLPALVSAQDEVIYYHTDAVGSVRMITDATGAVIHRYDYLPFGEPWDPPPNADVRRFAGKERDSETGLSYFGARYYRQQSGLFLSGDPGHVGGDVFDPQSWNAYSYALNNPLRFVDPFGTEPCQITLTGADATAAGVIDGGTVDGECVRPKKFSWSATFWWAFDGLTLTAPAQAPAFGSANEAIPDRSPGLPAEVGIAVGSVALGRSNSVYRSLGLGGEIRYVGITNNLAKRAAQHLASRGISIRPLMSGLSRSDARAVEQALIEIHGLGNRGGTLLNKINSISPSNPVYAQELHRGYELLRSIGYR